MHQYVHNALGIVKSKRTYPLVQYAHMEFDDRPDAAQRLEQARLAKGLKSAREAAIRFGWKYDTYSQHERGERGLIRAADRYAKAYGVSAGWLLTGEGVGPKLAGNPEDEFFSASDGRSMGIKEASFRFIRELERLHGKPPKASEAEVMEILSDIAVSEHFDDHEALTAPQWSRVPVVGYVGAGAQIIPLPSDAGNMVLEEVEIDFPTKRGTAAAIVRGDSMLPVFEDGDLIGYYKDGVTLDQIINRLCIVCLKDGRMYLKTVKINRTTGQFTLTSFNATDIDDADIEWAAPFRFRISRFDWRIVA